MIPSGSYIMSDKQKHLAFKSVISSAILKTNIAAFTSLYKISLWNDISIHDSCHQLLIFQHSISSLISSSRISHSAPRRFAGKAAACPAVALWWWIINHWISSVVRRLPVQRPHCHSHAHVPLPQGVYVTFSDGRLYFKTQIKWLSANYRLEITVSNFRCF